MTQLKIDPAEWNFRSVPEELRADCLNCEIMREQIPIPKGLTRQALKTKWPWFPKPWQTGFGALSKVERQKYIDRMRAPTAALRRIALTPHLVSLAGRKLNWSEILGAEVEEEPGTCPPDAPHLTLETFVLDWRQPNKRILEAFKAWIDQARKPNRGRKPRSIAEKAGPRLEMLAAYRIARAAGLDNGGQFTEAVFERCYTHAAGLKGLGKQYQTDQTKPSWHRAIREARRLIAG